MATRDGNRVNCQLHGNQGPAILSQHLIGRNLQELKPKGWVQAQWNPDAREPGDLMAWCAACDVHYELEGEWNETSEPFAAFRVVCESCFWQASADQQSAAV